MKIVVLGAGQVGSTVAHSLSNEENDITIVDLDANRMKILQDRLFEKEKNGNVSFMWDHNVEEVLGGDTGVTGRRVKHAKTGDLTDIEADGIFIAIGHNPNSEIFKDKLDMKNGYITIKSGTDGLATMTSKPGVFAAGDVTDHVYRQAVTSAGFGCMAALDADRWLEEQKDAKTLS